ncbi:unnamed protein product [Prorocentrum cordatum]|uniref:Uncharacterized protein n=1 Tax=Prorocentrum cordatum TaxID=2364126 RepID=A0ABN9WUB1_9DINO|nr:unnamed protein product [Polarella glacialis]
MESYGHGALGRVLCPLACPVQPSPTVQSRTLVAIFRDAALFSLPRISEVSAAPRVPRPYDFRAVEASGIEASAPLPGRRRAEGGEEEWYGMDGYGDMSKWYGMNGEVGENGWGREDGELGPYQSAHYGQHNQAADPFNAGFSQDAAYGHLGRASTTTADSQERPAKPRARAPVEIPQHELSAPRRRLFQAGSICEGPLWGPQRGGSARRHIFIAPECHGGTSTRAPLSGKVVQQRPVRAPPAPASAFFSSSRARAPRELTKVGSVRVPPDRQVLSWLAASVRAPDVAVFSLGSSSGAEESGRAD